MKSLNFPTSACRCCRYYQPEGRRGGMCQQLSVPVRGSWKACSLALSPFVPSWKRIEVIWEEEALGIKERLSVPCSMTASEQDLLEESGLSNTETLKAEVLLVTI